MSQGAEGGGGGGGGEAGPSGEKAGCRRTPGGGREGGLALPHGCWLRGSAGRAVDWAGLKGSRRDGWVAVGPEETEPPEAWQRDRRRGRGGGEEPCGAP